MIPRRLVFGTRASPLARAQCAAVAARLERAAPALEVETLVIRTEGDHLQQHAPAPGETLPKGLFTGALELALKEGRIDLAVHSLKDLPTELPEGLVLAAVPERADARDAFLSGGPRLMDLPRGARVATGSPRRALLLSRVRPDLEVVPIRGNVETRISRLRSGDCEGLILAAAGLLRLGRLEEAVELLPAQQFLPAPGQGALGIEMRADEAAGWIAGLLEDPAARSAVEAERAVLVGVGGGCSLPLGAFAALEGDALSLRAVLFSAGGGRWAEAVDEGTRADARSMGREVAARLLDLLGAEPEK
ncbi:MAG: hydroxymethylbilane synthase [Planctomycetes bacterium]|nr:hydroxymethylbilane synthase [Planctomycetota bacterium]